MPSTINSSTPYYPVRRFLTPLIIGLVAGYLLAIGAFDNTPAASVPQQCSPHATTSTAPPR